MDGPAAAAADMLAGRLEDLNLADITDADNLTSQKPQATGEDKASKGTMIGSAKERAVGAGRGSKLLTHASVSEDLTNTTGVSWGDGCFHDKGAITASKTMLFAVHFESSSVNDLVFHSCKFINVVFRNCNLSNVQFRDTFFENVTLEDSDLDDLIWVSGCWQDETVTGLQLSKETKGVGDPVPEQISDPNWVRDKHTLLPRWSAAEEDNDMSPTAGEKITPAIQVALPKVARDTHAKRLAAPQVQTLSRFEQDRYDGKLGPFRFLDLGKNKENGVDDAAIRSKIYSHLLASEALEIVDASSHMLYTCGNSLARRSSYLIEDTYWPGKPKACLTTYLARRSLYQGFKTGVNTSVLRVNQQMHKEAAAILYGQNITFAGSADGALAWLKDTSAYKNLIRNITFQYRFMEQTEYHDNFDFLTLPITNKDSMEKLYRFVVDMVLESPTFHSFELVVMDKGILHLLRSTETVYIEEMRGIANVAHVVTAFYRRNKIDRMGQREGVNVKVLADPTPEDFTKTLQDCILAEGIRVAEQEDEQH